MKRRLHQAPLLQMERVFAGEQSVAEKAPRPLETAALMELALVRNQHIADQIRPVDQKETFASGPDLDDVAVGARKRGEERERIAARTVDDERSQRPRRA